MSFPLDELLEQPGLCNVIAAQVASALAGSNKVASEVAAASPMPDRSVASKALSISAASPIPMVNVSSPAVERFASAVVTMLGIPPAEDHNVLSVIRDRVALALLGTPGFSADAASAIGDKVAQMVSSRTIRSLAGTELLDRLLKGIASSPMRPLTRHTDPST